MPRSEEHDRAAVDRPILKHCGLVARVRDSDAWLHFVCESWGACSVSVLNVLRGLEPLIQHLRRSRIPTLLALCGGWSGSHFIKQQPERFHFIK